MSTDVNQASGTINNKHVMAAGVKRWAEINTASVLEASKSIRKSLIIPVLVLFDETSARLEQTVDIIEKFSDPLSNLVKLI